MRNLLLPSTLGRIAVPGWQFPAHIRKLQRVSLDLLYDNQKNRLIIEVPVRHGKSYYFSYLFPACFLLTHPYDPAMIVSYGSDFATEWSSKVRDLIRVWGPCLTGVSLNPEYRSMSHFRLQHPYTGELRGLGIGGGLSGKGAKLIICDDLVKEFSEVATEENRDKLYRRFHGEVLNRLEPGGKIILVMSRRHPDDLSGRLLKSNADLDPDRQWRRITFPALSDTGEALWPERFSAETLLKMKRDYELAGESWIWDSLFQQDPATAAELCEWPASYWDHLFYTDLPKFNPRFKLMSLDPSMGRDKKKGDYSALLFGLVDPQGTLWIDDPVMVRVPLTQLEDLAVAMLKDHKPQAFAVESNNFQELVATNIAAKSPRSLIYPYESKENKEVRIRMGLTRLLKAKQIRVRDTPQGRILGQQLRDFPLASHDDGPDSLTLLVRLWRDLLGSAVAPSSGNMPVYTS